MDLQHHELALIRQHFDNCFAQFELRLRDEMHVTMHAVERRVMEQMNSQIESLRKRQDEQCRWIFGMLVVVFLSNTATIATVVNLLLNR